MGSSGIGLDMDVDREGNAKMEKLRKGIAEFYDESSTMWENIWGDHMHHGFYDSGSTVSLADHRSAQIRMIEEALHLLLFVMNQPKSRSALSMLDVV